MQYLCIRNIFYLWDQNNPNDESLKTRREMLKEKYTIEEIHEQVREYNLKKEAPRGKIKVLYVDDEINALTAFKASFRKFYDVFVANSGEEGRAIMKEQPIEVILSDQRMPKETGVEFLNSILDEYPKPIRILLTGYSDIDAVIDAINQGRIYQYVSKPYKHEEMKYIIEHAAEVFNLRNANEELTEVALRANKQLEFLLRQKLLS